MLDDLKVRRRETPRTRGELLDQLSPAQKGEAQAVPELLAAQRIERTIVA